MEDKRPGVAEVAAALYPPEEEKASTDVKQEEEKKVVPEELADTEDKDDPKTVKTSLGPKPTSADQVLKLSFQCCMIVFENLRNFLTDFSGSQPT